MDSSILGAARRSSLAFARALVDQLSVLRAADAAATAAGHNARSVILVARDLVLVPVLGPQ